MSFEKQTRRLFLLFRAYYYSFDNCFAFPLGWNRGDELWAREKEGGANGESAAQLLHFLKKVKKKNAYRHSVARLTLFRVGFPCSLLFTGDIFWVRACAWS